MKKSVLALSVAAVMGGGAGAVSAQTADRLVFNPEGVGHILIVPYFSTQSGNATLLNIVNTDTVNGKALKVRFRGASNSDDVYDFQLFLSPSDVWTASITQGASGLARLTTSDRSCTVPANVNGDFITSRLNPALSGDALANETREGYVEILNMGDIPSVAGTTSLWYATKHNAAGTAPCTRSILDNLTVSDDRLRNPTTGLMANWTIINVTQTTVWSGEAAAIEARTSDGVRGTGRNVYWPQRADPVGVSALLTVTADPLFLDGAVTAAQYDIPDLSTPYVSTACIANCAQVQANALSFAMAATRVAGEYLSTASINATTDWVVSKPTRRYYAAVDYTGSVSGGPVIIDNLNDNGVPIAVYYRRSTSTTTGNLQLGNAINGGKPYQACVQVNSVSWWDREERAPDPEGPVISPGQPKQPPFLCGEVSVLGINSPTSPLGASVARVNATLPSSFSEGWGLLTALNPFAPYGNLGLPMLVTQFSKATNSAVSPGISGTFGANYPGRKITRGAQPPLAVSP